MADKVAIIQKGTISFKWKGGKEVTLACTVEDGEVVDHDPITISGMGELESVTVAYGNEEHSLCLECQTNLIKTRMIEVPEGSGALEEALVCSNPDCPG